jgi:hypothetical protein
VLRVANSSGFYGDRFVAPREMIDGGPIDVLTGDYLAELTMAILMRQREHDPAAGFARTFLDQLEVILDDCLARDIKIVTNAGGLNPAGLAHHVERLVSDLGRRAAVATVAGDDLTGSLEDVVDASTGSPLSRIGFTPATANAYLGGWGIAVALDAGADIVITGRVTDAALTIGPAASHFGWDRDDWDALAGALVAGHVIECGPQATGGNFSFFREVPGLVHPGFPIAEIEEDGSSTITKHPGSGGLVSIETVTAQLLYEIGPPRYLNPDVTAHLDTVELAQSGPNRVRISGVRGEAPPPTSKAAVIGTDGFQNSVTFLLTGLDIEEKAHLVEAAVWARLGGKESVAESSVQLLRTDQPDPESNVAAMAYLHFTVRDKDAEAVGRRFSSAAVELSLSNYPGLTLTAPPGDARRRVRYHGALVKPPDSLVTIRGDVTEVPPTRSRSPEPNAAPSTAEPVAAALPDEPTDRVPLGDVVGARSGDKGGDANVGVWARTAESFAWLDAFLTVGRFKSLMPEAAGLPVRRYRLANLNALNFVVEGILGDGVADSVRWDPQAKGLAEYLRARVVEVPVRLLGG